jgi:putative hydrolase of HD superfamily
MESVDELLTFIYYCEGLKRELRNSWLSNSRQESVADHSWRAAVLAAVLSAHVHLDLNLEKVVKMILVHDLGEVETGDIPTIQQTESVTIQKSVAERAAFSKMRQMLGGSTGDGLYALWQEFEEQSTPEARYVKAVDKLECVIQKNQQTVDDGPGAQGYFEKLEILCAADPFLSDFYERVFRDVRNRKTSKQTESQPRPQK